MSDVTVPPPPGPPPDPPSEPDPARPLATLQAEAAEREPPTFTGTVAAAGGLLIAASVLVFVEELPDDATRAGGIGLSIVLLVAGMVARQRYGTEPIGKAGVAAIAVSVLPLVVLVVLGTEDPPDKGDATIVLVLAALAFGVLYIVGPSRAATVLLALGLFTLWQTAVVQTFPGDDLGPVTFGVPFGAFAEESFSEESSSGEESFGSEEDSFGSEEEDPFGSDDTFSDEDFSSEDDFASSNDEFDPNQFGVVSLLVGGILVLAGYALDRRRIHASATAFFLIGDLALVSGIIAVGFDTGAVVAGILSIGAGATLALLGSESDRRFTTWLGGFGALAGITLLIDEAVDDSGLAAGFVLLIVGAAVVAAAHVAAPRLHEREQSLTPPEPPPTPAP